MSTQLDELLRLRELVKRAEELLRNATNSGYMVYTWAVKREQWLRDAGMEK